MGQTDHKGMTMYTKAKITVFDVSDNKPRMIAFYMSNFVPRFDDRLFVNDKLYVVAMVTWGEVVGQEFGDTPEVALFCEPAE